MVSRVSIRARFIALCTLQVASAYAIADAPKRVDIPAGELSVALLKLSKQYGADLVYRPEQVHGLMTRGAHGSLNAGQAVAQLLQGTPLELRTDLSGAILIAPPMSAIAQETAGAPRTSSALSQDASHASKEGKNGSSGEFRVAQMDQGTNSSASALNGPPPKSVSNQASGAELAEVVVTAQKRTENINTTPIAVTALSMAQLQNAGVISIPALASNVPDLQVHTVGADNYFGVTIRGISNLSCHGGWQPRSLKLHRRRVCRSAGWTLGGDI